MRGLRAFNLIKKLTMQSLKNGKANNLHEGDVVLFDLTADEIWLKVMYDLVSPSQHVKGYLELMVSRVCNIIQLRKMLQKLTLEIWNE